MKTRAIITWSSSLAVALLAFGSQIALAQEARPLTRAEVHADVLQAQKSGELERMRITSYSANPNWGPGAAKYTSVRARAIASRDVGQTPATGAKPVAPVSTDRARDPV